MATPKFTLAATPPTDDRPRAELVRSVLRASGRAHYRTSRYLLETVTGHRARAFRNQSLPVGPVGPLGTSHAVLDELIMMYFQIGRDPLAADELERVSAEIDLLLEHQAEFGVDHHTPTTPKTLELRGRKFAGLVGEWLTFRSGWKPHSKAPGRVSWLADPANDVVPVALLRHDGPPRPWLVMVHGAEMGRRRLDARIFRAQYFHETLGVNIAMPVLPRHGVRGPGVGHVRGEFPSQDLVANVHGLTQAVWDVRRLLLWLRSNAGAETIGVYGFSLGGNVTAQLARFEPDIDALVAACPAVELVDLISKNIPPLDRRRLTDLLDRASLASQVISPLGGPAVVQKEKLAIITATHDRLADPLDQAGRLWTHWGKPDVHVVPRGHVTYMMGREPVDVLEAALRSRGIVDPEHAVLTSP